MDQIYLEVEGIVWKAQRDLRGGVSPKEVMKRLPYARAEGSVRRDMLEMYRQGRLVRIGGNGARRGYRLPNIIEKTCFELFGFWPAGCEGIIRQRYPYRVRLAI